ncbi:hypothetical protein R6Q57_015695 [Mikania cordata]
MHVSRLLTITVVALSGFTITAVANPVLCIVDGGKRIVLFDGFHGVVIDDTIEGSHILIPWLQIPYIFDIRTRPQTSLRSPAQKISKWLT